MLAKMTMATICAGVLGLGACAHDAARDRASVSAVTNKEVADNSVAEGKTRQHYTEVDEARALGRDNPADSTMASARAGSTAGTQGGSAEACELAVYFQTDSARLDTSSQQSLDRVAECMKRREVDHATIVGQTDPSGTVQHNEQLGLERARVVAEYLRGRGVPDDQIRVRSRGEVAAAESRQLWPAERRAGVDVAK